MTDERFAALTLVSEVALEQLIDAWDGEESSRQSLISALDHVRASRDSDPGRVVSQEAYNWALQYARSLGMWNDR